MFDFAFDEESHEGSYDGQRVKSVTTILHEEGFIDTSFFTEYGRVKGTYTHDAVSLFLNNNLDEGSIDEAIKGRFEAFKKFKAETGFKLIEHEVRHFEPVWRFTGKPDLVGELYNKFSIIDLKPWSLQWWTKYQVAAYTMFYYDAHAHRYALRLGDDGRYRLVPYESREDIYDWKAILTVNRLKDQRR